MATNCLGGFCSIWAIGFFKFSDNCVVSVFAIFCGFSSGLLLFLFFVIAAACFFGLSLTAQVFFFLSLESLSFKLLHLPLHVNLTLLHV